MKPILSLQEVRAIRLVHHDFMGRTCKEVAIIMDISEQRLSSILRSVKKKAPQMFPILTENQNIVYMRIIEDGWDRQKIADYYPYWSIRTVDAIIVQLRKKGVSLTVPKTVRYEPHLDDKVIRKF